MLLVYPFADLEVDDDPSKTDISFQSVSIFSFIAITSEQKREFRISVQYFLQVTS